MNQTKQFYLDHDQTTIHKYTNIIRNYEEEIKEELNYSQIIAQYVSNHSFAIELKSINDDHIVRLNF